MELETARPQNQLHPSMASTMSHSQPARHNTSRQHSHSLSLGSVNPSNRVTRRKSMTSSMVNSVAVIAAAVNGVDESIWGDPPMIPKGDQEPALVQGVSSAFQSPPAFNNASYNDSLPNENGRSIERLTVIEGVSDFRTNNSNFKARMRRASEGAHLSKSESRRSNGDLRCQKCGKGYKHSSCLTKHLWEHTPEWTYTSKLLISKHQQVQLLEAASVLVGMNQDHSPPVESARPTDSDNSSASPAASGFSGLQNDDGDNLSSPETTPPPSEHTYATSIGSFRKMKRHSSSSSVFSKSYQSAPSTSISSVHTLPGGTSFGNNGQVDEYGRSSASGATFSNRFAVDEEEAGLIAAVESLCSFGTPRSGPVHLPADVPPVPPLPARFAGQGTSSTSRHSVNSITDFDFGIRPPPLVHRLSDERHATMNRRRASKMNDDDELDELPPSFSRNEEDDDGVFGRMEE